MRLHLSKRMERLSSLVTEGNRLADVGTDHGYIPIALVERGKIPSALALDVNPGPLGRAGEHIRAYGLDTYIKTRLSDGLDGLKEGEADTVMIAGMGGRLTVRILEGGARCLAAVKELILQPQSEIHLVRAWLLKHGFYICAEDIVKDEGKYYPMMRAVRGGETASAAEEELYYGAVRIQKSPEVLEEYLEKEMSKTDGILGVLRRNGQKDSMRMREMESRKEKIVRTLEKIKEQKQE